MSKTCVHKTVLALGIFELLISFGIIVCGIFGVVLRSYLFFLGHGIWGGAWFGITSVFAITAGRWESKVFHVMHMVFAIISCVFVVPSVNVLLGFESSSDMHHRRGSLFDEKCWRCTNDNGYSFYSYDTSGPRFGCPDICQPDLRVVIIEIIAMVFCGLLFIVLIISASFTCCAVCVCCGAGSAGGVVYPHGQENVVVYTYPMQQTPNFPVYLPPPNYSVATYPSAPCASHTPNDNHDFHQSVHQPRFSASLAEIQKQGNDVQS